MLANKRVKREARKKRTMTTENNREQSFVSHSCSFEAWRLQSSVMSWHVRLPSNDSCPAKGERSVRIKNAWVGGTTFFISPFCRNLLASPSHIFLSHFTRFLNECSFFFQWEEIYHKKKFCHLWKKWKAIKMLEND